MDWTELENYIIDLCKKTEELNNAFKDKLA